MNAPVRGTIVTFYSFKGGLGRTMALANIAVLLARRGKKVLVVDFDLEAPGLDRYLVSLPFDVAEAKGLLDLLVDARANPGLSDERYVHPVALDEQTLWIMTAGRRDARFGQRVLDFDWHEFFEKHDGGAFIERLRDDWAERFDFVLIDSRTGLTDAGGICTVQLPDVLVAVVGSNRQSLDGACDVIVRAQAERQRLAYDRAPLAVLPLVSRFDSRSEFESSQQWLDKFAARLEPFMKDWLPAARSAREFFERVKIPYVAYFSFGENLPVVTHGTKDPESIGFAFDMAATLLSDGMASAERVLASTKAEEKASANGKRGAGVRANEAASAAKERSRVGLVSFVSAVLGGLASAALVYALRPTGPDDPPDARADAGVAAAEASAEAATDAAGESGEAGATPPAGPCRAADMIFVEWTEGDPRVDRSFCLDAAEVTVADYVACIQRDAGSRCESFFAPNSNYDRFLRGDEERRTHPMNAVTWERADAYCRIQDERLPTEDEWEYAASSGGRYEFPWGTGESAHVCRSGTGTCPVKSFPASPWGFYDMAGNVMEWSEDQWCDPKAHGRCGNKPLRVVKGGSWDTKGTDGFRAKWRDGWRHDSVETTVGFRCAASPRGGGWKPGQHK